MKVGILTFHSGLNHGGYMQVYAMVQTLLRMGHDPTVIHYKNFHHWTAENVRPWYGYRRPVRFLDHCRQVAAFRTAIRALPLSSFTWSQERVRTMSFDAVITGSDVVWDTNLFGFDDLYFGGVSAQKRLAYAVSVGTTSVKETVDQNVAEGIRKFNAISVRDKKTAELVERVTGILPPRVVDPVFLLENLAELPAQKVPKEKFVLVYGGNYGPKDIEIIRGYAHRRGLRVFSVGRRNIWADQSFVGLDPRGILSFFQHAEFVFSCTFHGCVFALQSGKPFVVRIHPRVANKVNDLLNLLGLENRGSDELEFISSSLDSPIDLSSIGPKIRDLRLESLQFLKRELG